MHLLTLYLFSVCLSCVWLIEWKALDEFVNLPDPHYEYTFLEKEKFHISVIQATFHTIKMTSQKWLDEAEVDKLVWSHKLTIVVPRIWKKVDSCLLIITPGQNEQPPSSHSFSKFQLLHFAIVSESIVVVLTPLPVQPLTFYKHPLGRKNITGYDIMAYTWWRFLNDSAAPPHWLVQFPMVKATVRAMDTITDYVMKTYHKNIRQFTLTGISMNAWITWLTAAVDSRVAAIIPIGMDFLNFTKSFRHQYQAYCGWSYTWRSFYDMNMTQELDNPRFSLLVSQVDPLAYNERYTNISEYMIIASGDEFSMPDNSHYYFHQLEGKKNLQIIPNADTRFQGDKTLLYPITVFYRRFINNERRFFVFWQRTMTNTSGIISLNSSPEPYRIFSYHADTADGTRRDFRMRIAAGNSSRNNPVKWTKTDVEHVKRGLYKKELEIPAKGWRGFFIQAIFPQDKSGSHLVLTSEIHIIPDTFPCQDCNGNGCIGTLV